MARQMVVRSGADLGAVIAEARRQRGLTQEELARSVNLDRTYLARVETGRSVLLLDRVFQFLRRLGVEVVVTLPGGSDVAAPEGDRA